MMLWLTLVALCLIVGIGGMWLDIRRSERR